MTESAAPADNHRQLFLLNGSTAWCRSTADSLLGDRGYRDVLWVTTAAPQHGLAVTGEQLHSRLGGELDALVFDAWAEFDPDAFGAAVGMVRGGGAVLMLTPPLPEWPHYPDPALRRVASWPRDYREIRSRFLLRLVKIIKATGSIRCFAEGGPVSGLPPPPQNTARGPEEVCRTAEQQQAVDAICHVVHGHRRRPLVLTADRGRGKSSALGIAAARLLQEGLKRILVTAPNLRAANALFQQADRLLPGALCGAPELRWNECRISFMAPDALLEHPQQADLLLVDEAAAIPAPLLEELLRRHSRIVFATTIHGYEGTGRGFAVRFRERLDRLTPGWRALHISSPIRWHEGDPVEQFTFRALLLNASPARDEDVAGATAESCTALQLDRDQLLNDELLLGELFGLLVLAHYRTRPSDLRNLLDCPDLSVHALLHDGHLAAAALVVREGGLDEELANRIWLGHRRVHGHLLPQSLAVHAGFPEAASLRYARIMRLAVHPAARRRGMGTRLVAEITDEGRDAGLDAIGTSFGATPELLDFWHRAGFRTTRMGLRREASSGSHAALMLHPLSVRGKTLCQDMQARLREQLPGLFAHPLSDLEPGTAWRLLQSLPTPATSLSPQEWRDAISFAFGKRGYLVCMAAIRKLVVMTLTDRDTASAIPVPERELLVRQILQERWKRDDTAALRRAVRRMVESAGPRTLDIKNIVT